MTLKDLLNVINFGFNEHRAQVKFINIDCSNNEQKQTFSFNFGLSGFVDNGRCNIPLMLSKKVLNAKVIGVGVLNGYLSVSCAWGEE